MNSRLLIVAVVLMLAGAPFLSPGDGDVGGPEGTVPTIDTHGIPVNQAPDLEELDITLYGTFWEDHGRCGDASVALRADGPSMSVEFSAGRISVTPDDGTDGGSISMELVGADGVVPRGEDPLGFPVNVFERGSRVATVVKGYRAVKYNGVREGVDVLFRMDSGALKYDVLVAPGSDPGDVAIRYVGADSVSLDPTSGGLLIRSGRALLTDAAPVAYQDTPQGRVDVEARFLVDGGRVSFDVGAYDQGLPLVIDPALNYSTYLGTDNLQMSTNMMLGDDGFLYMTGYTYGRGFPVTHGVYMGAYVMKVNPANKSIVQCSVLIDSEIDRACIDGSGAVYLTGTGGRDEEYITPGAFCETYNGGTADVYVVKVAPNGTYIEFGTYLGGRAYEVSRAIAVDSSGNVYVGGSTGSDDFPASSDALSGTFHSSGQGFLTKLSADGSSLVYSSGFGDDLSLLKIDDQDNVFIFGMFNYDYPPTDGAYNTTGAGYQFIKVKADLKTVVFSTYFEVRISDIDLDDAGDIYLTGRGNKYLNVTSDAFQKDPKNSACAYITKMDRTGSTLLYSTLVGGSGADHANSIFLDEDGGICIAGETESDDFPVSRGAFDDSYAGGSRTGDGFVVKHVPGERNLTYATYLGGSGDDYIRSIVVAPDGNVVVWGLSNSVDYPTTPGAYDEVHNGLEDSVLTFVGELTPPTLLDDATPSTVGTGEDLTFRVNATDNTEVGNVIVEYWFDDPEDTKSLELALVSGTRQDGTWGRALTISTYATPIMHYRVVALDRAGTADVGAPRDVTVLDRTRPALTFGPVQPSATTGETYNITVTVNDNWMVGSVYVNYWFGDDPASAVNATMTGLNLGSHRDGTYFHDGIQVSINSTEGLQYFIVASDEAGNWVVSEIRPVTVRDNDPPEIIRDLSDTQATTGDNFTFTVRVRDNIGIGKVLVSYKLGDGSRETMSLEAVEVNRTYSGTIALPGDFVGVFAYRFTVGDTNYLQITGEDVTLTVTDNDPPTVVRDLTDGTPMSGVAFTIRVDVSDNVGVADVQLRYALGGRPPAETTMSPGATTDVFTVTIDVPLDFAGTLTYSFLVTDGAGNSFESGDYAIEVVDGLPPSFGEDRSDGEALKGTALHLEVEAMDNVGLQAVTAAIYVGGVLVETLAMALDDGAYAAAYTVPRDATGTLGYSFTALDADGNSNSTRVVEVAIANAPPALDVTEWTVVEGVPSALDLAPHLSDANDDIASLTVSITDPDISVDGQALKVLYDAWRADRVVRVTVSDGEDSVTVDITVKVTNVNDAPVITSVAPEPGPEYKEGEEIFFSATAEDEDGDELTYVWRLEGTVINEGREFSYKDLKGGTHTVTLEVSDGNETVTKDVVVVVKKKEKDSPGASAVLAMGAVLAVAAAFRARRDVAR